MLVAVSSNLLLGFPASLRVSCRGIHLFHEFGFATIVSIDTRENLILMFS